MSFPRATYDIRNNIGVQERLKPDFSANSSACTDSFLDIFSRIMPGQESSVLTREVIVVRTNTGLFDQFYLLWALTLKEVVVQ